LGSAAGGGGGGRGGVCGWGGGGGGRPGVGWGLDWGAGVHAGAGGEGAGGEKRCISAGAAAAGSGQLSLFQVPRLEHVVLGHVVWSMCILGQVVCSMCILGQVVCSAISWPGTPSAVQATFTLDPAETPIHVVRWGELGACLGCSMNSALPDSCSLAVTSKTFIGFWPPTSWMWHTLAADTWPSFTHSHPSYSLAGDTWPFFRPNWMSMEHAQRALGVQQASTCPQHALLAAASPARPSAPWHRAGRW